MKLSLLFGLLFLSLTSNGQTSSASTRKFSTSRYAGTYSYGKDVEKGRIGTIFIYPETDSTVLFYIDLNRGTPSYNMGSLYGRVLIKNGNGIFYTKFDYTDTGCKWNFLFTKNKLTIITMDNQNECGFGYAVFSDGVFDRRSTKSLESFEDMEGTKVFFRTTKPEDYYKD